MVLHYILTCDYYFVFLADKWRVVLKAKNLKETYIHASFANVSTCGLITAAGVSFLLLIIHRQWMIVMASVMAITISVVMLLIYHISNCKKLIVHSVHLSITRSHINNHHGLL